jgi:hypothetical protein
MNCSICISWQLWARSADSRSFSAITQSFEEILPHRQTLTPHRHKTTLIEILPQSSQDEIPRDSTRFHVNRQRTILTTNSITIPICLLVKWLHQGRVRQPRSSSISKKTGNNGYGNSEPLWISKFGPTLTQIRKRLNEVYYKHHPI